MDYSGNAMKVNVPKFVLSTDRNVEVNTQKKYITDHLSDEVVRLWVYNVCSFAQTFTLRTQSPVLYVLPGYRTNITTTTSTTIFIKNNDHHAKEH